MARLTNKCRECQQYKPKAEFQSTTEVGIFSRVCSTCLKDVKHDCINLDQIATSFSGDLEVAKNSDDLLTFNSTEPTKLYKYKYEVCTPNEFRTIFDFEDAKGSVQKKFVQEKILNQLQGIYNFVFKKYTSTPYGASANYMCIHDHHIYNLRCKCRQKRVPTPGKISAKSPLCKGCLYVYFNSDVNSVTIEHRHMHHVEKNSVSGLSLTQRQKISYYVENSSPNDHLYTNAVYKEIMESGSTVKKDSIFRAIRRAVERKRRGENPILNSLARVTDSKLAGVKVHQFVTEGFVGIAFFSKEQCATLNAVESARFSSVFKLHGRDIQLLAMHAPTILHSQAIAYAVLFKRTRKRKASDEDHDDHTKRVAAEFKNYKSIVEQASSSLDSVSYAGNTLKKDSCREGTAWTVQWFLGLLKDDGLKPAQVQCQNDDEHIKAVRAVLGEKVRVFVSSGEVKRAVARRLSEKERINEEAIETYFGHAPTRAQVKGNCCWATASTAIPCDCTKYKPCPQNHASVLARNYPKMAEADIEDLMRMLDRHASYSSSAPVVTGHGEPGVLLSAPQITNMCIKEALEWCLARSAYSRWLYLWRNWYCDEKRPLWMRAEKELLGVTQVPEIAHSPEDTRILTEDDLKSPQDCKEFDLSVRIQELLLSLPASLEAGVRDAIKKEGLKEKLSLMLAEAAELQATPVVLEQQANKYQTDPLEQLCDCSEYSYGNIRMCRHILAHLDLDLLGVSENADKLEQFCRDLDIQSSAPYWRHKNLVVRDFKRTRDAADAHQSPTKQSGAPGVLVSVGAASVNASPPELKPELDLEPQYHAPEGHLEPIKEPTVPSPSLLLAAYDARACLTSRTTGPAASCATHSRGQEK